MEPTIKMKRPNGLKERAGWLIYSIGCPIAGAFLAQAVIHHIIDNAKHKGSLVVLVIFGVFVAFPWFWYVSMWVLMPIWNSLYIPMPDLPVDEGAIISNIYKINGETYLMGHGHDILTHVKNDNNKKLVLVHLKKDERKLLNKVDGTVKVYYKFIKYRDCFKGMYGYRNTPTFRYKWPVYEYKI